MCVVRNSLVAVRCCCAVYVVNCVLSVVYGGLSVVCELLGYLWSLLVVRCLVCDCCGLLCVVSHLLVGVCVRRCVMVLVWWLASAVRCVLLVVVVCCVMCVVCCVLRDGNSDVDRRCWLLVNVCCLLFVGVCSLSVAGCVLFGVYCSLFVVCFWCVFAVAWL